MPPPLNRTRKRLPFALCGYCFMPDHIHVIIFPEESTAISPLGVSPWAPLVQKKPEWAAHGLPWHQRYHMGVARWDLSMWPEEV